MCAAELVLPCARVPKPPQNFRRFSITPESWSPILSERWHTCKKDADPDTPAFQQAKAEYIKLK
jgi:hypothetical protein